MMKKAQNVLMISALSLAFISGCENTSSAQKGAAIGALTGAVAGKATGDNDKSRYVWGAALGAIAGSAVGSYMDNQEEELRNELSDSGVEVVREGDQIRLVMPGNLTFANDSAAVDSEFYPVLNDVAAVLQEYDDTKLKVEGHTDSIGTYSYNKELSMDRANAVALYLESQDIKSNRLQTIGMGETDPITQNFTPSDRQENRRVELMIIPVVNS